MLCSPNAYHEICNIVLLESNSPADKNILKYFTFSMVIDFFKHLTGLFCVFVKVYGIEQSRLTDFEKKLV